MRHIDRFPEPEILRTKGNRWLADFLASGKKRPDCSKYAHPDIKQSLESMSHTKCFYCECSLKDFGEEVDHHIEVTVDNKQAFEWTNLYLSCPDCNKKIAHNVIPTFEALDPVVDSDEEIKKHITFVEDTIVEVKGSVKGQKTIQKYRLDSKIQDNRRQRQLGKLFKTMINCLKKGGMSGLTEQDKESIRRYTYPSSPYSYMCECYLKENYPGVLENPKDK